MKKFSLALVVTLFLIGCKDNKETQKTEDNKVEEMVTTPAPKKENTITIGILDNWPEEIVGCSCSFSKSKSGFESKKFVYVGDFENKVFMMVNGKIEQFKLVKSNASESLDNPTEIWSNDNYEFTYTVKKVSQVGETQQYTGKLTLKTKSGETVEQDIYGECGC